VNAVSRIATRAIGSVCEPVVTVSAQVEYRRDPEQWDRDYLQEVAGASQYDSYDLCGNSSMVSAICRDYGEAVHEAQVANSQLAAARAEIEALKATVAGYRTYRQTMEIDIAAERNRHQSTVLELEMARDVLADAEKQLIAERTERVRLQALAANLSSQLRDTSQRLIDVSFEHATNVIKRLGGEDVRGQSMVFDTTADTTVVDVVIP